MSCNTSPNIAEPDEFFAALVRLHEGLTDEESMRANARLILLLANQIGDAAVLREAVRLAGEPGES